LKAQRLYKTVATDLLKLIDSGKYQVGDRLPAERDLAIEYNVSRPTMREAVIALEIAGRVEVRKGSGVYIASMITDEEIIELEATIDQMKLENENANVSEDADKAFHMIIARATRNSVIETMIDELWTLRDKSELTQTMYETVRTGGVRPSIDEHWAIFEALKSRNPVVARAAMRNHLSRVIDTMFEATEIEAFEEVKRRVSEDRQRYKRLLNTG